MLFCQYSDEVHMLPPCVQVTISVGTGNPDWLMEFLLNMESSMRQQPKATGLDVGRGRLDSISQTFLKLFNG